jgi:hypothetical protein
MAHEHIRGLSGHRDHGEMMRRQFFNFPAKAACLLRETGKGAGLKLGRQYICLVCDLQMVAGAIQFLRHGGEWM